MKKRGIIIEGSDCAGKTSLVKALKGPLSHAGWDVADLGHRVGRQFDRYLKSYLSADRVILDRGHFSEVVYGDIWRQGIHFAPWELDFLNQIALSYFVVILAHADPEVLRKRYIDRTYDQIIDENELSVAQNGFMRLMTDERIIKYESKSPEALQQVVDKVLQMLGAEHLTDEIVKQPLMQLPPRKQFILLEGVNGSGKSTLAKLLKVGMVGWGVKTLDYRPGQPFQRYLEEYVHSTDTIFDRGHFSEVVYGNLFRNREHFSPEELRLLNTYCQQRGTVIFCDAPVSTLATRVKSTKYPKHIHEDRLAQVRDEFLNCLNTANIPYQRLDTTDESAVAALVQRVTADFSGTPYSAMGWDAPPG